MKFRALEISGLFLVEPEPFFDARGFFARSWCTKEFAEHGLSADLAQCNISYNRKRGTLRGLHYQREPFAETKLIRCTRGAVFDVAVDLRENSRTFGQWCAVELTEENCAMFYIPAGFAHGFQTLTDSAELFYQMSCPYHADTAAGVRYDDPDLAISWPLPDPIIAPHDLALPLLPAMIAPNMGGISSSTDIEDSMPSRHLGLRQ